MKWMLIVLISGAAVFGIVRKGSVDHKERKSFPRHFESFAILELFTSEGCSSCPPADKLLPQLASSHQDVIPLSFHVDYWNRLGWTDPFSSAKFTERQNAYANEFRLQSIYTPQLIINGQYELVGSNRSTAEADIKKVLDEKTAVTISIDEVKKETGKLMIRCSLTGDLHQTLLNIALAQKHAEMSVRAGENKGATLSHTNVVRSFAQKDAQQKMNFEVAIPSDINDDNLELIIYSQQKSNLKVTGAAVWEGNGQ